MSNIDIKINVKTLGLKEINEALNDLAKKLHLDIKTNFQDAINDVKSINNFFHYQWDRVKKDTLINFKRPLHC